jgi:anti-sigma-K factor RskA
MHTNDSEYDAPQLEAYALGALDAEARLAVEELLARSDEHRLELQQLREVVALLPFAAAPAAPPARVREQLFSRIAASQASAAPVPAAPRPTTPARRWAVPAALAMLATLLLALGGMTFALRQTVAGLDRTNRDLVATLVQLERTLAQTQSRQDTLAAQVSSGQDKIDQLNAQVASGQGKIDQLNAQVASGQGKIDQLNARIVEEQHVVSFLSAPGVATRTLNAAASGASARGEMYMYPGQAQAVVVFSGLPALAPGQVYQFWLADAGSQVAGGLLAVDTSGIATLVVEAPRAVNAFSQVMLTVEPAGGSSTPSQQVVLQGAL